MHYLINGELIQPTKIFLEAGFWFLEGKRDNKKTTINLSSVRLFDGHFIDEVVIVRPLTNRIIVDQNTDDVLKVYVDQKDNVVELVHESRNTIKQSVSLADLPKYDVVNDAFVKRKKR